MWKNGGLTRRGLMRAFAAAAVVAAPTYANAFGFLRGAGDIRAMKMYSARTGEQINMIYWADGKYIPEALQEISRFMRDWRNGEIKEIDKQAIDIVSATHGLLDVSEPYLLISGYRSPETNEMLRRRSKGVAKNSLHLSGKAADLRLKSRDVQQLARAAASLGAGGVGRYSRSNFVHMDSGNVRSWGS
ncbi:YcbK family protein [Tranquillimonas alkanivorans]|uniref:YcbK family protein n=1 Tax=Tranquillimonas alkanivorans TaxID=441119 RepID=UPI000B816462|nr:DUF882 domain-containing protein [Tranquillimonas alkanivorans]